MPIYEYTCSQCGGSVEKMQRITDDPLRICPACGGELRKKISLTHFKLVGSGWYTTDYAGKKPTTSGNGNGNGNGHKTEEAKSESVAKTGAESTSTTTKE